MRTNGRHQPVFREVQRFRHPLFWLIVLAVAGLHWAALLLRLVTGRLSLPNPMPDPVLIVSWLVFGLTLPLFAVTSYFMTELRADGLYIRYFPFYIRSRRIPFHELEYCQVISYEPPAEYGGWGLRFGKVGRAYTVGGDQGVLLGLVDGRQLLIGSQTPGELARGINAMMEGTMIVMEPVISTDARRTRIS